MSKRLKFAVAQLLFFLVLGLFVGLCVGLCVDLFVGLFVGLNLWQIKPVQASYDVEDPSEVRGVFVKWLGDDTWHTLCDEYQPYGINWLVGEGVTTYSCRSNLTAVNQTGLSYDYIGEGITQAHAHDMTFTCMMLMGFRGDEAPLDSEACAINQTGDLIPWACPIKTHDLDIAIVTEIATTYPDLDGFMFDYIRYTTDYGWQDCFCEQCEEKFKADTGLSDAVFPTDAIIGSGKYADEWVEWRVSSITNLAKDCRTAMLAINPDIRFSIAALSLWYEGGIGYGYPIRKWYGQDIATMVAEGYIDTVCPMQYTTDLTLLEGTLNTNAKYMNGYYEGKVSFVPLIGGLEDTGEDMTPENLTNCINLTRTLGCDGYLIYRQIPNFAEEYLSVIDNDDSTFSMTDINHTVYDGDNITVTWETTAATSSVLQYSTSPLFYSQELTSDGFKYYQVTNASFTTVSDETPVTTHTLSVDFNTTFNENTLIYFRVQSADANNTLTSRELSTNAYPTIGEFQPSTTTPHFSELFNISCTIQDLDGTDELKNASLPLDDSLTLTWAASTDTFSKIDPNNYANLGSASARTAVNATAYTLTWNLAILDTYPEGQVSITGATVFDINNVTGTASQTNEAGNFALPLPILVLSVAEFSPHSSSHRYRFFFFAFNNSGLSADAGRDFKSRLLLFSKDSIVSLARFIVYFEQIFHKEC